MERFEEMQAQISPLTAILKMMQAKSKCDANLHIFTLLESISKKSLTRDARHQNWVKLGHPVQQPYCVTPLGFQLLEQVEGALGSMAQDINSVDMSHFQNGPFQSSLISRISRQRGPMTKLDILQATCAAESDVAALQELIKITRLWKFT